jgi:hypothetical protein
MVEAQTVCIKREVWFRHQDTLSGDTVNRFTMGRNDPLEVFYLNSQDDQIRFDRTGEPLKNQHLLVGAGAGHSIVVDFHAQFSAQTFREAITVVAAVPRRVRVSEKQDPGSIAAGLAKLAVRTETQRVGSDIVPSQLIRDTGVEIRDVQEPDVRIMPDDHPMCRLA